jgi:hypothetical protein
MNGKTILGAGAGRGAAGRRARRRRPRAKLYRWVDKDGKVHYDDALPPERSTRRARNSAPAAAARPARSIAR